MNPHQVTRDFERGLCEYTGAPYAVTTTSCTDALKLAVAWHLKHGAYAKTAKAYAEISYSSGADVLSTYSCELKIPVEIPKRTYVGVPMAIMHAGGKPTFRDADWIGAYQLKPLPVWDSARWFTSGMYAGMIHPAWRVNYNPAGQMVCVSFHWNKTLGIQQGGAILHDNAEADKWLRMARFDGRQEGVAPKDQKEWIIGHHCYMSPEIAAAGLVRLSILPQYNEPLPADDFPDLSEMEIFR